MFTASSILYQVDVENKIVTATATGMKNDAIDTMLKAFRKENIIFGNTDVVVAIAAEEDGTVKDEGIEIKEFPLCTCGEYLLPNEMRAQAKYDPNDPHEYDLERGKQIARRRLYDVYNRAYMNALFNLQYAINQALSTHIQDTMLMTHDRLIGFEYFEAYDVFKSGCDCTHTDCDECDVCNCEG